MALSDLATLAVVLVVVTIAISMGSLVVNEMQDTSTIEENSTAYNATNEGLDALDTAAGFLPVVGIVVVAAVIIGIVASQFRLGGV